ncbi:hypothetical protein GE21DRAFT_1134024 [Neurospora crassa]|nr:hypothetical protein GE21DRAFT_1134024 [Neurospora crassa]
MAGMAKEAERGGYVDEGWMSVHSMLHWGWGWTGRLRHPNGLVFSRTSFCVVAGCSFIEHLDGFRWT